MNCHYAADRETVDLRQVFSVFLRELRCFVLTSVTSRVLPVSNVPGRLNVPGVSNALRCLPFGIMRRIDLT